jgi:hypothetical protein
MHLTSQQATEKYKLSLRTLRTLIAGLTAEQRQKYIKIEGKRQLISTKLLSSRYELRTGVTDAPVSDGASVQFDSTGVTDAPVSDGASVQLITQQQNQIAHLQNEVSNLHDRLKEANYIAANLAKHQAPSTTKANDGFFWFIVGLVLGFTCLGFVIWFNS